VTSGSDFAAARTPEASHSAPRHLGILILYMCDARSAQGDRTKPTRRVGDVLTEGQGRAVRRALAGAKSW
jgi:hypothetical protein